MWLNVVHKWSAAKSGRHDLQIWFSTFWAVMKVWRYKIPGALPFPNGLPTFLGLTRISALLPGQLVLEYSILMSITRKSSGSQLGSSTMISLLKKVECALIFATIGSFIYVCKCPLHAPPIFRKKKKTSLFLHQICAALILSFIFKLPLESCNSQMLCLL